MSSEGAPLVQPQTIASVNGTLNLTLTLEFTEHLGKSVPSLGGTVPGPTLLVQPGDTLYIRFENKLPAFGSPHVNNQISGPSLGNLHFHGLHASGELPSDDTTIEVGPGATQDYVIEIGTSHMPGTHWVHPHQHGSSAYQVGGGAALALIVADPPDFFLPNDIPDDVLLVVQQWDGQRMQHVLRRVEDQGKLQMTQDTALTLVNGQIRPTISVAPGSWTRLRVLYAAWRQGKLNLEIPGCRMVLIAKDGIYLLDKYREINRAPIVTGGRADILVSCPNPSTRYPLESSTRGVIGYMETTGADTAATPSEPPSYSVEFPSYLTDLRDATPSPGCSCTTVLGDNSVNGRPFDKSQYMHVTYLGAINERQVDGENHPYHQHVYPFQVQETNEAENGYIKSGDWHDTILANPRIRYQSSDFAGKIMVHCHRLVHEDEGMMSIDFVNNTTDGTCTCVAAPLEWWIFLYVGFGVLVLLGGGGGTWWWCRRRRRRQQQQAKMAETPEEEAHMDG